MIIMTQKKEINSIKIDYVNQNAKEITSAGWDILVMGMLKSFPKYLYQFWGSQKAE